MVDSNQINISKRESKRFKMERIRSRGNPNGRPYGQKPKDTMQAAVWNYNDAGGLRSRKFVDHSKNRQRRQFMTDIMSVQRIRFCRFYECYRLNAFNRAKFGSAGRTRSREICWTLNQKTKKI